MTTCDLNNPNFLFRYCPSLPAAGLFTALFGLAAISHIIHAWHYRKPFCWVVIMGAFFEFLSSLTRTLSIQLPEASSLTKISFVLLSLAPLWINAFDYMVLGRMVYFFIPEKKLFGMKAERIAMCFICMDITCFIIQMAGVANWVQNFNNPSKMNNGLHIYTAGVAVQQAVILVFLTFGIKFQKRLTTLPKSKASTLIIILYITLALISFRIIFRILNYAVDATSNIHKVITENEWYTYVFDEVPMFFALVAFLAYHPGRVLKGPGSEYPKLTKEEKVAKKQEEKRVKEERRRIKRGDVESTRYNSIELGLVKAAA